jgi:hypothetical protein
MAKNYRQLTESIRSRINPDNIAIQKAFSDELSTLSYSDVLTFIRFAMKSVEPEYTQKSRDAGERVKEHLSKELKDVSFKYQGSVMTNTHIKGYSDIDLLRKVLPTRQKQYPKIIREFRTAGKILFLITKT